MSNARNGVSSRLEELAAKAPKSGCGSLTDDAGVAEWTTHRKTEHAWNEGFVRKII